ncbi:MAG TPA: hypothetical protein PLU53_11730 [Bacteroidia bacterium]|nr:hypothetical protein [Bacteroidia bacterium]
MNTISLKRSFDLAYLGLIFQLPVILYWFIWGVCYLANDNNPERLYMFYTWVPREITGIGSQWIVLLFCTTGLSLGVTEKMIRRTRWYKTVRHVRLAIAIGVMLLFMNVLEIVY